METQIITVRGLALAYFCFLHSMFIVYNILNLMYNTSFKGVFFVSNNLELGELSDKQSEVYHSIATEIMYGGAAGGGKSHMMRILAILWCLEIDGLMVYLFRRLSDDLKKNHMEGPSGFFNLLSPLFESGYAKYNDSKGVISFIGHDGTHQTGSKIFLSHFQHEDNKTKYQGAEIHVLLVDELTHFTKSMYTYLRGRMRLGSLKLPEKYIIDCPVCSGDAKIKDIDCNGCSVDVRDNHGKKIKNEEGRVIKKSLGEIKLFPRSIMGTNPGGIGHNWVKGDFVDRLSPMVIEKMSGKDGGMYRQYIPARADDNDYLDDNYDDKLSGVGNPALVKALRDGDWNITDGGAFDDLWKYEKHVIKPFSIPSSWRLDRSYDWGAASPFSVLWFAESDGTEAILPNGDVFCPPRGSVICIHEFYGGDSDGKGLNMPDADVAKRIKIHEKILNSRGIICSEVKAGPADNAIFGGESPGEKTCANKMKAEGVKWTKSYKDAGSRELGLITIRDLLSESLKVRPEAPCLYFFDTCKFIIRNLPVLQRDKNKIEDVDTTQEDHDYDALRYRVSTKRTAALIKKRMSL